MSLFLISFLSLYGGMHVYAFVRLRGAFRPGAPVTALLVAVMALMTIAPLLVWMAETGGFERTALLIAWPGYSWMGGIFIFTAALVAVDSLRCAVRLSDRLLGTGTPGFLTPATTCATALILAMAASVYAMFEARNIRTDHVTVTTSKLPPSTGRVRVVQISDVHMGLLFRESRLRGILEAVGTAGPDILVSTGDLVDGRLSREEVISRRNRLAVMLAALPAPQGKFAVTGNHEFYAGVEPALAFTRAAGFTVLRNRSVPLPNGITITGVDDPAGQRLGLPDPAPAEPELLRSTPAGRFQLLLKHRPEVSPGSDGLCDLQLSGHTHKGQLIPFYPLTWLQYRVHSGTTIMPKGMRVHVSRGSGTWGPPMRLFAPPEVTVIDIVPER